MLVAVKYVVFSLRPQLIPRDMSPFSSWYAVNSEII